MHPSFVLAAVLATASPEPAPPWQRLPDGVRVHAQGVHLRLRVCSPRIVRVTAWPEGAPEPSRPSLAVVAAWSPTPFEVKTDRAAIVLSTARLRARVAL